MKGKTAEGSALWRGVHLVGLRRAYRLSSLLMESYRKISGETGLIQITIEICHFLMAGLIPAIFISGYFFVSFIYYLGGLLT